MSDIELDAIRSGYNLSKINSNFEKVEDVINDDVLHRSGGNNTMSQELDMNSNKVINTPRPKEPSEVANKQYVDDALSGVEFSEAAVVQVAGDATDKVMSQKAVSELFALKIFQSPAEEGLTEIQTRTVGVEEVYEVRKTSDDSLATIYSNASRTTEIVQNGTDNKSGSDGTVEFYIDDGDYYVEVGGVKSGFITLLKTDFETVDEAKNYSGIEALLGNRVYLKDRQSSFEVVLTETENPNGMDVIQSASNTLYSFKYTKRNHIDAVHLGADSTGVLASDKHFNRMFEIAYTEAYPLWGLSNPYSISIRASSGFYTFETGFSMVQTGAIRGDTIRIDFEGDGQFSTHLCSRGSPTNVIRIDGRYCSASKFAVLGSIDEIRDSDNSATYGINIINQRNGSIREFRVAHIVGAGLRIGKSIVNHISDGVIYRCGSSTLRAVEQTDPNQDGFQASTFKNINIEDSHGIGAFKFRSHRNSKFDSITFEQQPYFICELSSPSGGFLRDESLSFTNGATGFVALSSSDGSNYINGNGEVVVRDLDESGGALQVGDTVTSTGGATGVVKAFTDSGGEQFRTEGEFGQFDGIWLNQNALRFSGSDFLVVGSDNSFGFVRLRDTHRNIAVNISGNRNDFDVMTIQAQLLDLSDESEYLESIFVSGSNNEFNHVRSEFSKGVSVTGVRNTIKKLTQRQLYGQSISVTGDFSKVMDCDVQHATYIDTGDLLTESVMVFSGVKSGLCAGVIKASSSRANDIVTLSGVNSFISNVELQEVGACTNGVRTSPTADGSKVEGVSIPSLNSGATGVRLVGAGSKLRDGNVSGGSSSIQILSTGSSVAGTSCENYTSEAVYCGNTISAISVTGIECSEVSGAARDVFISTSVTNSIIKNNLISRGAGAIVDGGGVGNVIVDNV